MDPMDPSPSDPSTSMYILPAPQGKRLGRNASQKMSRRANEGVKRPRQQHGKEEKNDVQPAPLHLMAHPTMPLPLLSVAQSLLGMCVLAQLCDAQGAALFPFVRLPPRVRRPFAGAPVHDMSLTHGERLRVVGCALTGKLVRLLLLGTGCSSTTTTSTVSTTTAPTPITGTSKKKGNHNHHHHPLSSPL